MKESINLKKWQLLDWSGSDRVAATDILQSPPHRQWQRQRENVLLADLLVCKTSAANGLHSNELCYHGPPWWRANGFTAGLAAIQQRKNPLIGINQYYSSVNWSSHYYFPSCNLFTSYSCFCIPLSLQLSLTAKSGPRLLGLKNSMKIRHRKILHLHGNKRELVGQLLCDGAVHVRNSRYWTD